ncbi:hypothetical protein BDY24DRAFT_244210 [Mrakia frigida]|uniref:uncharacterized protein n=1 Tax=Mrakia frigida TaxID=29902 RepID=UPI003FCC1ED4
MLSLDPAKRPCVKEILAHPWFAKSLYPPPVNHSNFPSPTHEASPLPPSPLAVFDDQRSNFFVASDPEPVATSSHPEAASGSEVSETSFEFHDGDRSIGSGVTTPTTVESGDAGGDEEKEEIGRARASLEGVLAKDGASIRSTSTSSIHNVLRRTGSESTIRKSGSESSHGGNGFKASSRIDLTGDVMEEEDESALDHEHDDSRSVSHQLLPLAANSRTPSRTKRRSISSNLSERLTSNTSMTHLPHLLASYTATPLPLVDYVALLSQHRRSQFSTPVEQEILGGLEALGFDTGQLVHSVTNDACDTSGALWWILKGKRVAQRRDEAIEEEVHQHVSIDDSGLSEMRKLERARGGSESPTSNGNHSESDRSSLRQEVHQPSPQNLFSRAEPPSHIVTVTDDPFSSPSQPPPPSSSINIEPPTPTVPTSESQPDLSTISSSTLNPFGFSTSRSFPNLQDPSSSSLRSSTPEDRTSTGTPSPASTPGKSRRHDSGKARSSSVSMLHSLAAGLVRKKSDDKLKEDGDSQKTRSPSPNKLQKPHPITRNSTVSSPSRPPISTYPSSSSSVYYEPLAATSPRRSTHPIDRISEATSLPTIHAGGSVSSAASKSSKPPKNNSILTTFRMWFKEDSKKRGGKRPSHLPTSPNHSSSGSGFPTVKSMPIGGTRPSSRRNSVDSRRNSGQFAPPGRRLPTSTLDRPMMARRSSSQQSVHSRRSSVASLHLPPIDLSLMAGSHDPFHGSTSLNRRPSDPGRRSMESRTPTSESGKQARSQSRPSSVRSFNLGYPPGIERNMSRSPTASSAGSTRRTTQASPLQHYHRRVGSGSSTKVVRQIKTVHSSHGRTSSAASSIRSNPNSSNDLMALGRSLEGLGIDRGGESDAGPLESLDEEAVEFDTGPSTPREEGGGSRDEIRRPGSAQSSYSTTVLVAHRTKSALSSGQRSPHGSIFHNQHSYQQPSRALSRASWTTSDLTPRAKPVLRDVFASKPLEGDDGDWEDEDDGFEGGLGQGGSKKHAGISAAGYGTGNSSSNNSYSSSSANFISSPAFKGRANAFAPPPSSWAPPAVSYATASSSSSSSAAPTTVSGKTISPLPTQGAFPSSVDTPALDLTSSVSHVHPHSGEGGPTGKGGSSAAKASVGARRQLPPTAFRSAGIIEEDEDEEEE